MGTNRYRLIHFIAGFILTSVVTSLVTGCWSPAPIIRTLLTPGHTARNHAAVSLPAITTTGDKVIVCGDQFKRFSQENELEYETTIPLAGGWSADVEPLAIYNDTFGNLYLDHGDELAGINEDGEIQWRIDWFVGEGMLFPDGGGILIINQIGSSRYLIKLNPDGTEDWKQSLSIGHNINSQVVMSQNLIYFLQTNRLVALDLEGTEVWSTSFSDGSGSYLQLSNSGDLTVVGGHNKLYAIDDEGVELWSYPLSDGFISFGEFLVMSPDRIVVKVAANFPSSNGLLILDSSGNQVNFLVDFNTHHIAQGVGSEFMSLEATKESNLVGLHSGDTGELLWQYTIPELSYQGAIEENGIVDRYTNWRKPVLAQNGLIYFIVNSTLVELDYSGNLIHTFPSTVTADEWVYPSYSQASAVESLVVP